MARKFPHIEYNKCSTRLALGSPSLLLLLYQVFIQSFNSADAGTINVIGALAAMKAVDNSTISSSSAGGVMTSPQNAFGLDQQCLQRCGLGATGGGLSGLSAEMQVCLVACLSPFQGPRPAC